MDDWRLWRQDMFQLKDSSWEQRPYFCPRFDLADDLDYRYNREWGAECALTHYVDIPRMQDHLRGYAYENPGVQGAGAHGIQVIVGMEFTFLEVMV